MVERGREHSPVRVYLRWQTHFSAVDENRNEEIIAARFSLRICVYKKNIYAQQQLGLMKEKEEREEERKKRLLSGAR